MSADAAGRQLEAVLKRIYRELPDASTLPIVAVASIHSVSRDGETLSIMVDLEDGHTAIISVCPGSRISVGVVD